MDSPQAEEPAGADKGAAGVEQKAPHVIIVGAGKLHFFIFRFCS